MKLLLGTTLIACLLGICVDMVTAHVAVEYFSVHHPHVIDSQAPWALALAWGVGASWWFGAIGGAVLLAVRSRVANPPSDRELLKSVAIACAAIWATMISVLLGVYAIASLVPLSKRTGDFESNRRLMAVAIAHENEYILGALALIVLCVGMIRRSRKHERLGPGRADA